MKKIATVLVGMMFTATVTAQTDTIKEKIDNVRLELQQEQVSGTTEIHNTSSEVPTKLNNGIETRNTSGNEVQKPIKRYGAPNTRQPTTDEINARAAAKLNTPQITTTTTPTSPPNTTRVNTTPSTQTDSTKAAVPAKTIRKSSPTTSGTTKAVNTKRTKKT